MNDGDYIRKKGSADEIAELLEHPAYARFEKEIIRLRDAGASDCCDVNQTQAKRDAGAGAKNMGDQLLGFLKQKHRALTLALGQEKKRRSRKRATQ